MQANFFVTTGSPSRVDQGMGMHIFPLGDIGTEDAEIEVRRPGTKRSEKRKFAVGRKQAKTKKEAMARAKSVGELYKPKIRTPKEAREIFETFYRVVTLGRDNFVDVKGLRQYVVDDFALGRWAVVYAPGERSKKMKLSEILTAIDMSQAEFKQRYNNAHDTPAAT